MTRATSHRLTALIGGLLCAFLVSMGLTVVTAAPAHAAAVSVVENGISFTANDSFPAEGATVIGYDPSAGSVVTIPNNVTIGGLSYPVTTIGGNAFFAKQLTNVTISGNVTTIGDAAFFNNQLTGVDIPVGVTAIGDFAFFFNQLASVEIPKSVTSIGDFAFADNRLTSVSIPAGVASIGDSTFNNNLMTSVNIPSGVTSVGRYAFHDNQLTSVDIPASVTAIGDYAFGRNTGLLEVWFAGNAPTIFAKTPSGTGSLGANPGTTVFYGCGAAGFTTDTWQGYPSIASSCTVTFDSQGGTEIADSTVEYGVVLDQPSAPTRAGHTFAGWHTSADAATLYDFATPVTGAFTLYAGWQIDSYTVAFDSQGGSTVADSTVDHGGVLVTPAAPTRTGYTFTGWFTDVDAATLYDFATPVTGAFTLYAGWKADDVPTPPVPPVDPVDPVGPDNGGKTPVTPEVPKSSSVDATKDSSLARTGAPANGVLAGVSILAALGGLVLLVIRRRTA